MTSAADFGTWPWPPFLCVDSTGKQKQEEPVEEVLEELRAKLKWTQGELEAQREAERQRQLQVGVAGATQGTLMPRTATGPKSRRFSRAVRARIAPSWTIQVISGGLEGRFELLCLTPVAKSAAENCSFPRSSEHLRAFGPQFLRHQQ